MYRAPSPSAATASAAAGSHSGWRTAGRALVGAIRPDAAAQYATFRRSDLKFARRSPRPTVIGVIGYASTFTASTVTALLAQTLNGLAPSRVATLDTDGIEQSLRVRLGAGAGGDLRRLIVDPQAWAIRRRVDRYVAHEGPIPVLSAGFTQTRMYLSLPEILAGLHLLRRRYPVVVVHVHPRMPAADTDRLSCEVDHVVMALPPGRTSEQTRHYQIGRRSGRLSTDVTVLDDGRRTDADVHLRTPLVGYGPIRVTDLTINEIAAIAEIVARVTNRW